MCSGSCSVRSQWARSGGANRVDGPWLLLVSSRESLGCWCRGKVADVRAVPPNPRSRRTVSIAAGFGIVLGAAATFGVLHFIENSRKPTAAHSASAHTLGELLTMTPEQLSRVDIAEMNLLCAKGLP